VGVMLLGAGVAQPYEDGTLVPFGSGLGDFGGAFFGADLIVSGGQDRIVVEAPGEDLLFIFDGKEMNKWPTREIPNQGSATAFATLGDEVITGFGGSVISGIYWIDPVSDKDEFLHSDLDVPPQSLDLRPGLMVAGMPDFANGAGRVRVHRYKAEFDDWISDLPLDGVGAGDGFGQSVAFDSTGDFLFVGAPDAGANGQVEVYAYVSGNWVHWQTVEPPSDFDSQFEARFGHSIAVRSGWLAVGAPDADRIFTGIGIPAVHGGIVSLYQIDGLLYEHRQRFQAVQEGANLGFSVSLSEGVGGSLLLVAGAPGESTGGRVRTYSLAGDTWSAGEILARRFPQSGERFGAKVSSSGRLVAVGSPSWDYVTARGSLDVLDVGRVSIFVRVGVLFEDGFESGDTSWWE